MTERKLTSINPLIADGDLYQTAVNCRSVTRFLATSIHEVVGKDLDFGRYLILETVAAALKTLEAALDPAKRQLEVVNG